jgi:transcriptional regulator with XRE-family HTH domain
VRAVIGENLEELRRRQGLTQEQIAARAGVKQAQYSKWETGRAVPKPASLLRLAVAFQVTVDNILAGLNHDYDRLVLERQQQVPVARRSTGGHR